MHPLRRYLRDVGESVVDFSERIGASRQTLHRIMAGGQTPRPDLARRIVEATGGAVAFEALFPGARAAGCGVSQLAARDRAEDALDAARLKLAFKIVVSHLWEPARAELDSDVFAIGAEAAAGAYHALAEITSRTGRDRLRQALRPVVEEILREIGAPAPAPSALDRAADLAAQIYLQDWRTGAS